MRYEPAQRLLRLALRLAGTRTGLTLDEIAADLGVGRRTAERQRDALAGLGLKLEHHEDEQRVRRWRLRGGALAGIVEPRAESVAAVEVVARECVARGEDDRAALLREAAATLRALMRPEALTRTEPDISILMEAEGSAMRPGPRPVVAPEVLPALRRAILAVQLVAVRYAASGAEEAATRILCPYGVLHGGRGDLVAHVDGFKDMRLWRLDRLRSVDLLNRGFVRREDFDLAAYTAQSFGVFQEEPIDVVLRFTPEVADDAAMWSFHPTQSIEREADGSLTVRFHAGGLQEMCWHLITWGTSVDVLEPMLLRTMIAQISSELARHHTVPIRLTPTPTTSRFRGSTVLSA